MDLLFTGYYGKFNSGDDAFNIISDWGARKYWDLEDIYFFGRNLPKRIDNSNLPSKNLNFKYVKGQYLFELFHQATSSKYVIYSGGSLFHSEINLLSKNGILNFLNKANLTQLGAIGVSLGPFRDKQARDSIKEFLSHFSFLSLRDKRSYREALELGLDIPLIESFDLAALLPKIYSLEEQNNPQPVVGVSVCKYESYVNGNLGNEKRRFEKIKSTLKLLIKKIPQVKIKILVFNSHPEVGDTKISRRLKASLPKDNLELVTYKANTYEMWRSVSLCDVVLATRLHAGIFSFFSKTPFIQVEYHEKCGDFLEEIKYPSELVVGDIEVSEKEMCEKLISLINYEGFLFGEFRTLQKKALCNFTKTKKFINKE